jgi:hypothetical protein
VTPIDVLHRVADIRDTAATGNTAAAHNAEDQLYRDVLTTIADGTPHHQALAAAALNAAALDYQRWYA